MSAWIISIVGVIALGVLLEIMLPEGKTAKYVRGAFSLLVIFAIASPLPTLIKSDFKPVLDESYLEIDYAYVADAYDAYADKLSSAIEGYLHEEGIEADATVLIDAGEIKEIMLVVRVGDISEAKKLIADRFGADADKVKAISK